MSRIAIAIGYEKYVRLLDLSSGKRVGEFVLPSRVEAVSWCPSKPYLAIGNGRDVHILRTDDHTTHAIFQGAANNIARLVFSNSGKYIAALDWDTRVRIWEVSSGTEVLNEPVANFISFDESDEKLAGAWNGTEIGVWNLFDSGILRTLSSNPNSPGGMFAEFSPDSKLLVAGSIDGIQVWNTRDLNAPAKYLSTEPTGDIRFLNNGSLLLSTHRFGLAITTIPSMDAIENWTAIEGILPFNPANAFFGHVLGVDHHEKRIAATQSRAKRAVIFDLDQELQTSEVVDHDGIEWIAMHPDGSLLATASPSAGGTVKLRRMPENELVKSIDSEFGAVYFSHDGNWFAMGTKSRYDFFRVQQETLSETVQMARNGRAQAPVAFTANGRIAAISKTGTEVTLIETETGESLASLEAPNKKIVRHIEIDNAFTLIAAVCADHSIQLWDIRKIREYLNRDGLPFPKQMSLPKAKPKGVDWKDVFDSSPSLIQKCRWDSGLACYNARKWSFAKPYFDDILRLDNKNWKAFIYRGGVFANLNQNRDSLNDYLAAIRIDSNDATARAWHSIAILQISLGEIESYRQTCLDVLERFNNSQGQDVLNAVRTAALIPDALPNYDIPIELIRNDTEKNRNSYWHLARYGAILSRAGEQESALIQLKNARELSTGRIDDAIWSAIAHHHLGNRVAAISEYEIAVSRMNQHDQQSGYWGDWMEYELLNDEAYRLISENETSKRSGVNAKQY